MPETPKAETLVHATCLALEGRGLLLRGPSGSGKSDLALRLIEEGARLVADDQTLLTETDGRLIARSPDSIAGKLEVRGVGIRRVPSLSETTLELIVDLVGSGAVERLPDPQSESLGGVELPRIALDPFAASAPLKLRLALEGLPRHGVIESFSEQRSSAEAPLVVLVTGLSGAGHSTALRILEDQGFEAIDNLPLRLLKRVLKDEERGWPLAIGTDTRTRGFATQAFLETLDALLTPSNDRPVAIPRFNKALDDRYPRERWDSVDEGVDLVLLEGWCLGARPQDEDVLATPLNRLEREEDPDGTWRRQVNRALSREFEPLYRRIEQWVMLRAPSFDCVYRWRREQEQSRLQITKRYDESAELDPIIQEGQRLEGQIADKNRGE